ncbi:MAG: FkbM family methyltransferase [Candidatus Paceibacterota bacterium]
MEKPAQSLLQALKRLHIRAQSRYTPFTTTYPGFACFVPDKSSFLFMYDEIMGREIYKFTTDVPAPRILDCGANIGLATVYLKQKYPNAHVTCFEPDDATFAALEKNIVTAGLSGVELVHAGLGDKEETRTFFSEGADGGRVATSDDTKNETNITEVKLIPLSPYLNEPIDFLKIDIEGSEAEVLEECKDKLGNVKRIFVEYHSLHNAPQTLPRILEIMKNAGFRLYIEDAGVHSEHPLESIQTHLGYDSQLNIFGYRA